MVFITSTWNNVTKYITNTLNIYYSLHSSSNGKEFNKQMFGDVEFTYNSFLCKYTQSFHDALTSLHTCHINHTNPPYDLLIKDKYVDNIENIIDTKIISNLLINYLEKKHTQDQNTLDPFSLNIILNNKENETPVIQQNSQDTSSFTLDFTNLSIDESSQAQLKDLLTKSDLSLQINNSVCPVQTCSSVNDSMQYKFTLNQLIEENLSNVGVSLIVKNHFLQKNSNFITNHTDETYIDTCTTRIFNEIKKCTELNKLQPIENIFFSYDFVEHINNDSKIDFYNKILCELVPQKGLHNIKNIIQLYSITNNDTGDSLILENTKKLLETPCTISDLLVALEADNKKILNNIKILYNGGDDDIMNIFDDDIDCFINGTNIFDDETEYEENTDNDKKLSQDKDHASTIELPEKTVQYSHIIKNVISCAENYILDKYSLNITLNDDVLINSSDNNSSDNNSSDNNSSDNVNQNIQLKNKNYCSILKYLHKTNKDLLVEVNGVDYNVKVRMSKISTQTHTFSPPAPTHNKSENSLETTPIFLTPKITNDQDQGKHLKLLPDHQPAGDKKLTMIIKFNSFLENKDDYDLFNEHKSVSKNSTPAKLPLDKYDYKPKKKQSFNVLKGHKYLCEEIETSELNTKKSEQHYTSPKLGIIDNNEMPDTTPKKPHSQKKHDDDYATSQNSEDVADTDNGQENKQENNNQSKTKDHIEHTSSTPKTQHSQSKHNDVSEKSDNGEDIEDNNNGQENSNQSNTKDHVKHTSSTPKKQNDSNSKKSSNNNMYYYVGGGVVVVSCILVGVYYYSNNENIKTNLPDDVNISNKNNSKPINT